MLHWLKDRQRQQILAEAFPPAWEKILRANMAHYRYLSPDERAKLHDDLRIFIAEKHWEGCNGQEIDDEVRVTVAGHACLLVLAIEHDYFARVKSVLVYPSGYLGGEKHDRAGVVRDFNPVSGQAWYRGPVILSWADVRRDGRRPHDGHNVTLHEFAHQLDMLDGAVDGTPPLARREDYPRWTEVMTAEFAALRQSIQLGHESLIDPYGAESEGEFFAVVTECFFEEPVEMRALHPDLYEVLSRYYCQDPAARVDRSH